MFICVNNLDKGNTIDVKFSEELHLPDIKLLASNIFVDVDGTLASDGKRYIFSANVKTDLKFSCYSCLETVYFPLKFEMNEIYSKVELGEEILPFYSKDTIDFTDALVKNVILHLPMKAICSQNCKGLCYICGQNLNEKNCDCDRSYVNPKFEKFLELFNLTNE